MLLVILTAGIHAATTNTLQPVRAKIIRTQLLPNELSAPQPVAFELKLRNFDELTERLRRSEVLSMEEMSARYFPTESQWATVAEWATANGFSVRRSDNTHMTVFATGTVTQTAKTLHVSFARVIGTDGAEYTAAIDAPTLPPEVGALVQQVRRLHPEIRPKRPPLDWNAHVIHPTANTTALLPETVRQLYQANVVEFDGTGETIVVVGLAALKPSDLATFWTNCGLSVTSAQITEVDPGTPYTGAYAEDWQIEAAMDVEWVTAMAPKAKVIYISTLDAAEFSTLVMNRLTTDPSIHQLNESSALSEAAYGATPGDSQYYAALAALGVTTFVATGDGGSNGNYYPRGVGPNSTFYYDPSGVLAPAYPASDPFVTAVGGTMVGFTSSDGSNFTLPYKEGGWCLPDPPISAVANQPANWSFAASTGGKSIYFAEPDWQKSAGLPSSGKRCVPDVGAMAAGYPSPYGFFHGQSYDTTSFGGTSMSAPVWTGLCALLNQARRKAGFGPVGLLGPRIYPLMGTRAFNPIIGGSSSGFNFTPTATNGAYGVQGNYNFVTGLGSPNMVEIIAALTTPHAPVIAIQPNSQTARVGQTATFTTAASADPAPQFRWQMNGTALSDGTLSDGTIVTGSSTSALVLSQLSSSENGARITVAISNSAGTVTTNAALLTVDSPPAFSVQPQAQTVVVGGTAIFNSLAAGTPAPTYQWYKNNARLSDQGNVSGTATSVLTITNITTQDSGSYVVAATNSSGTTNSNSAVLTVATAPVITLTPQPQTIAAGSTLVLKTSASGNPVPTFQWLLNGVPLNETPTVIGTATPLLTVKNATSANAGNYTVIAATPAGQVTSNPIAVTVTPTAWLANLSDRTALSEGEVAIVGFTIVGGTENILVRAAGPALAATFPQFFSPDSVMADPRLEFHPQNSPGAVATNDDWNSSLFTTFNAVGAFGFSGGSKDAAFVQPMSGPNNTVWAAGRGAGYVLAEAYAPANSVNWPRLTNLSVRNYVRSSDSVIVGFVVQGSGTKRLLIRAIGPGLAQLGVSNVVADPKLTVYNAAGTVIAQNDNWDSNLKDIFTSVGAFALSDGSADAATVVVVPAGGGYTIQVDGVHGGTGEVLAEVYELP